MMDSLKSSLARIKIKFPEQLWISHIFNNFHDVRMEIENFLPYDLENILHDANKNNPTRLYNKED